MLHSRHSITLLILLLLFALSGCDRKQTVCPSEEETPQAALKREDLVNLPAPEAVSTGPIQVLIQGRKMDVDKLVDYPLCNDNWSGTVYVGCDVRVAKAELDANSNPLFLKGCDLKIAPNTVVYVAAHNDAPYYKGCSCHTGTMPEP